MHRFSREAQFSGPTKQTFAKLIFLLVVELQQVRPFLIKRTTVDEEFRAMTHAAVRQKAQAEPTNMYRGALQR